MRLVRVFALSLAVLALPLLTGPAAADPRFRQTPGASKVAPPSARTPSVIRGGDPGSEGRRDDRDRRHDDGRGRRDHPHRQPVIVVPQTVFMTPTRCWQPGYWTYQFVPQYYTYSAWVEGQWSADGRWIDGHYAPAQYSSGYYQPLWVDGYYTACY